MSGNLRINHERVAGQNPPAANGGAPHQPVRGGARRDHAASSIQGAGAARPRRPRNLSCLDCIGIFFRAIFRCLFWWCLPARAPRREAAADQNPPAQAPVVLPVDELVQPPQPQQNPAHNREPRVLTENEQRVQLFLDQFPRPKEDQEESPEDFLREFEHQIPVEVRKAARAHLIQRFPRDIADAKAQNQRGAKDDQKGSARKVEALTDDEAALFLMEHNANALESVRTYLEEHIGIYGEDEE